MVCLQSFCLEFLLFCPVLVVTWCACRVFVLFLFCSFLVNFTNLSWKEFNIILIILIYWVELYYYLHCFFVFFLCIFLFCFCLVPGVGVVGCVSIHEKDRGLRQHTINYIYVLVYYISFFHFLQLWLLSLNVMCCGLQLVLWFLLLALLNLGSRLQGFIWRSAVRSLQLMTCLGCLLISLQN